MGRFRWLEIEDEPETGPGAAAAPEQSGLDEHACIAKANELLRRGECETALKWYSRALRYEVGIEQAWVGQVRCLLELNENVEANLWADRALERFADSPDLLAAKALALRRTRGAARAMEYSDASLGVKGRDVGPYPWYARGEIVLNGAGSRQGAERCFNKALELGGADWYVHYLIGMSWLRKGLCEQARQRLAAAVSLERNNPMALCALADCYERLGEAGGAILYYSRALEADPRCKQARGRLEALRSLGPFGRLMLWLRGRR